MCISIKVLKYKKIGKSVGGANIYDVDVQIDKEKRTYRIDTIAGQVIVPHGYSVPNNVLSALRNYFENIQE